jgi:large subunit ribosomal protein L10
MPNSRLNELRQKVREVGGVFTVSKNTLIKRAFQKAKIKTEQELTGPTAIVFAGEDEVAPLQVLGKSIQETELPKLKFGIFGQDILPMDKLLALSKLPGRNVLAAQLLGALITPKYSLVGTLNENLSKLVYVLNSRKTQMSTNSHET